jgi:hypothetical protein
MARKPENVFKASIHRKISNLVYQQSMDGCYVDGTPDNYYEHESTWKNGWIEWKWTKAKKPRKLPMPTPLQEKWLVRAHRAGQHVAVIVGCPSGAIIFPWLEWMHWNNFEWSPVSRKEAATWIEDTFLGEMYR